MAHFVVNEEDRLERITLPDGEWIDVVGTLSLYERKRLLGATVSALRAQREQTPGADADDIYAESYAAGATAGLVVGIREWSFKDDGGNPIPVTKEWIRKLDDFTGEFIAQELDRLWARRGEEEAKNSEAPGARTAAAKRRSRRNSAG